MVNTGNSTPVELNQTTPATVQFTAALPAAGTFTARLYVYVATVEPSSPTMVIGPSAIYGGQTTLLVVPK
jgi:hypothetical protein